MACQADLGSPWSSRLPIEVERRYVLEDELTNVLETFGETTTDSKGDVVALLNGMPMQVC